MGARPKVQPIQLTKSELQWLHGHLVDLLGGSGYFYRGVTARVNAASIRDKTHAHLWPQGATKVQPTERKEAVSEETAPRDHL